MKTFVKRQKNDVAESIVKAASRPTMRFVALKSEDQQARAMLFRTRQMFIGQRTQTINARRRCAKASHPGQTLGRRSCG
ncbi:IS110 family transposase [Pseudorhodobacter turbinis]|uniref:IS110 family transposase n=1 Tax=Pseudorhodobacter turbinis TaxID=2500533 RepID=A0A4P8EF87_9RHOB|nr:IS110 family transposase [Pseudorhodobacter turbinis]